MLAYFLKINVAIALFYAFYRLFFYKDTFFTWRRAALLCFFAVSAVYPLLNIQTWITEQEPMVAMADLYADIVLPEFTITPEQTTSDWKTLLLQTVGFAYWGMVIVLAIRFFHTVGWDYPFSFPLPESKDRKYECTSAQTSKRTFFLLPLDFYSFDFTYRR